MANAVLELTDNHDKLLLDHYKRLQSEKKRLDETLKEIADHFKALMGDEYEKATCEGYSVHYKNVLTVSIDKKILKEKYPEIATECEDIRESKRFEIKRTN